MVRFIIMGNKLFGYKKKKNINTSNKILIHFLIQQIKGIYKFYEVLNWLL